MMDDEVPTSPPGAHPASCLPHGQDFPSVGQKRPGSSVTRRLQALRCVWLRSAASHTVVCPGSPAKTQNSPKHACFKDVLQIPSKKLVPTANRGLNTAAFWTPIEFGWIINRISMPAPPF